MWFQIVFLEENSLGLEQHKECRSTKCLQHIIQHLTHLPVLQETSLFFSSNILDSTRQVVGNILPKSCRCRPREVKTISKDEPEVPILPHETGKSHENFSVSDSLVVSYWQRDAWALSLELLLNPLSYRRGFRWKRYCFIPRVHSTNQTLHPSIVPLQGMSSSGGKTTAIPTERHLRLYLLPTSGVTRKPTETKGRGIFHICEKP